MFILSNVTLSLFQKKSQHQCFYTYIKSFIYFVHADINKILLNGAIKINYHFKQRTSKYEHILMIKMI